MSVNRGMDKEDVTQICNGILLSHKKDEIMPFAANMDGPRDYHTKWTQRKTNNVWHHLYVES